MVHRSIVLENHSFQTDRQIVAHLDRVERAFLALTACLAGAEFLLWIFPDLRPFGPQGWSRMLGSTAAAMLLAATSAWFSREHRHLTSAARWIWITGALLLIIFGVLVLIEYAGGISLGIDRLFYIRTPNPVSRFPGRPAPQSAYGFALVGLCLALVRARMPGWLSVVTDAAVVSLLGLVLALCGGYAFGAASLIGVQPLNITSPQTLICFGLLTFVLVARRARVGGPLRLLLCVGIGGQAVRVLLPGVVLFPFLVFGGVGYLIEHRAVPIPFAQAFAAVACALAGLFVVVRLTLRINALEGELREMVLQDELTGILNRRGFGFLADQTLREARRNNQVITVLFFDLDGLKETNDQFGHDVGDRFIADVASLIRTHFRKEDVVARIGGDELVVLMHGEEWKPAQARMNAAAEALNRSGERKYEIRYSVGEACFDPKSDETLEGLVARADAKMYANKLARKTSNPTPTGFPLSALPE